MFSKTYYILTVSSTETAAGKKQTFTLTEQNPETVTTGMAGLITMAAFNGTSFDVPADQIDAYKPGAAFELTLTPKA